MLPGCRVSVLFPSFLVSKCDAVASSWWLARLHTGGRFAPPVPCCSCPSGLLLLLCHFLSVRAPPERATPPRQATFRAAACLLFSTFFIILFFTRALRPFLLKMDIYFRRIRGLFTYLGILYCVNLEIRGFISPTFTYQALKPRHLLIDRDTRNISSYESCYDFTCLFCFSPQKL